MISLSDSYAYCHQLMRSAARNFYYGMRLLPQTKRRGMFALYGFMRLVDDIADDEKNGSPQARIAALEQWRSATHAAIAGEGGSHPLWPALGDTVRRFAIPPRVFDDAIDGQLQDMRQTTYASFAELYDYCYRVASTVGIASICIWGYAKDDALKLAEERGIAFQLTNILRDLREDAARGRRYLPTEDLLRFGLDRWSPEEPAPEGFAPMVAFEIDRTRGYYESSSALERLISPDARPTLRIMTGIYRRLLERIAARPAAILSQRVRLSGLEKLILVLRHAWNAELAGISERA